MGDLLCYNLKATEKIYSARTILVDEEWGHRKTRRMPQRKLMRRSVTKTGSDP